MAIEDKLVDWYLRYGFTLDRRFNNKQKELFIRSMLMDITSIHLKPKTDQYQLTEKGEEYTNIYVGDIEKADQVICTHYDTPSLHLGGYRFFDNNTNKKNILVVNFTLALLWVMIGTLITVYGAIPTFNTHGVWSGRTIFIILFFIGYFILLNKFSRGIAKRKNLVRNSSSILAILDFMGTYKKKNKVAYAFLDSGITNGSGLERVKSKAKGKILYLDSIGSENDLYLVGPTDQSLNQYPKSQRINKVRLDKLENKRVSYLISAQYEDEFYLSKKELNSKKINSKNLAVVSAYLKETVR